MSTITQIIKNRRTDPITGEAIPYKMDQHAYQRGIPCPNPTCTSNFTRRCDTRRNSDNTEIIRTRECQECKTRFTTIETLRTYPNELVVIKRNGLRDPFSVDKLRKSIERACVNRFIAPERIDRIIRFILWDINHQQVKEPRIIDPSGKVKKGRRTKIITAVSSGNLGQLILKSLKELDHVSYLRYAQIHYRLNSIAEIHKFIQKEGLQ